ncbi:MAG: GntR domain protein [Acidimicrobiales bacterium]|nr:GntR domain protein [Acidimicrobiales bacterium]
MTSFASSARHVRPAKTAVLVAAAVRDRIVRGELREGDALPPEAELSEQFSISRPTVREALRILESESLISIGRGVRSGARVHLPSREVASRHTGLVLQVAGTTLAEVYEARACLFSAAARLLAERRTKSDLRDLRAAVAGLRELVDQPAEFLAAAASFNLLVLELAGNRAVAGLARMLTDIVELHLESVVRDWEVRPHTREAEHVCEATERLVALIDARDSDGAERFWREQMEESARYTLSRHGARTVLDLLQ